MKNGYTILLTQKEVSKLQKEIAEKGLSQAAIDRGITMQQLRHILKLDQPRCSEKIYKRIFKPKTV